METFNFKTRFKKCLPQICIQLLFMGVFLLFYTVMFINIPIESVRNVMVVLFLFIISPIILMMIFDNDCVFYTETGIYLCTLFRKTLFCSWESITGVGRVTLSRAGCFIAVYTEQHHIFPSALRIYKFPKPPYAILIPHSPKTPQFYTNEFFDNIHKYRPDIVVADIEW